MVSEELNPCVSIPYMGKVEKRNSMLIRNMVSIPYMGKVGFHVTQFTNSYK